MPSTAEDARVRYWTRRDAGMCVRCGAPPRKPGKSLCINHWRVAVAKLGNPAPVYVTIVEVLSSWVVGCGAVRRG